MTFGQRMKLFRQRAKQSQKDLELETGIPQTTLSGWETGKTEPTVSDAKKLAAALGVTVAELLDEQAAAQETCATVENPKPAA